ncbi:hypothetical protein G9A89_019179 [Geosiphon pyriformis]|nr:hypothetical protein G9A89_019179 [Geosiphon pyriformis]
MVHASQVVGISVDILYKLASNSGIPGAETVVGLIKDILAATDQAENNKTTCRKLAELVKSHCEILEQILGSPTLGPQTLNNYIAALEAINEFIQKQQKHRIYIVRIINADEVAKLFLTLKDDLNTAVQGLTLLTVATINQKMDKEQKRDRPSKMPKRQGTIDLQKSMALMTAIQDNAPLSEELLEKTKINSDEIVDDPKEQFSTVRGSKYHVKKKLHTKGYGAVAEKHIGKVLRNPQEEANFWKEMVIWRELQNAPGILKFFGIVDRNGERYTITEWAKNGDLKSYCEIENQSHLLTWCQKTKIACQIAGALAFCHTNNVLHHDVRSHNILLDENLNAKLTNFAQSRKEEDPFSKPVLEVLSIIRWTAPEKLNDSGLRYTKQCDIYSFAIVLWELATQQLPFGGVDNYKVSEKVRAGERPGTEIPDIPEKYQKLMVKAWDRDPRKRPAMQKCYEKLYQLHQDFEQDEEDSDPITSITEDFIDICSFLTDEPDIDEILNEPEVQVKSLDTGINLYNDGKFAEAYPIIDYHAMKGVTRAKYYQGFYFVEGKSPVLKQLERGLALWHEAADEDDKDAQYKYALAYSTNGESGQVNPEISKKYMNLAFKNNHPGVLYNYGVQCFKAKQFEKGEKLLKKANSAGHDRALKKLAQLKKDAGLS